VDGDQIFSPLFLGELLNGALTDINEWMESSAFGTPIRDPAQRLRVGQLDRNQLSKEEVRLL
jgi:hypothetical protein